MIRATLVRALVLSAAFAGSLTPVRCLAEDGYLQTKATKELSPELLSLLQQKNMSKHSPILVRIFKEESELEVWKQDATGRFEILKIYPICRWSGDLGPKLHRGDRQAPEGFYTITPELMNPNSHYYLAINTGFPNTFDKSTDRDGAFLMIHGDCLSRGCYAMTDEQIGEIYSLARDSLLGSQQSFQIQAYPFRMTPENLARHRTNPNMAFWKMLKVGNDHFEAMHLEPKVEVCNRRYVFDAQPPANSSKPIVFDPTSACPAFVISPKIARSVRQKEHVDEAQYKQLVKANAPIAPIQSGLDGGMTGCSSPRSGNMPPSDRSPQPVPLSSTDNGSFASNLFGALFGSKPAAPAQVSSSDAATRDRKVDSATTGSSAAPKAKPAAQVETIAAAEMRSSKARNNASARNGARENDALMSGSQRTAAVQPTPTFEQEADAQPLASDHDTLSASSTMPADSFASRWGGLQ